MSAIPAAKHFQALAAVKLPDLRDDAATVKLPDVRGDAAAVALPADPDDPVWVRDAAARS